MGTEHEHLSLENGFVAEWEVNSHLVTVEVGVECGTCERMKLDCLTFNHLGLECLNTETVKSRGTVEQHGMTFHHVFEDVPNHGFLAVHNLFGGFDGFDNAAFDKFADNERFVKLGCHILGDTAFVHLQFRTNDDNRTCGVVDTFTEEVLTEAALLAFQ